MMKKITITALIFSALLILLILLLYKDIFSARTLVPNFEPFPDTFHYIVPARSLLKGEGFTIVREGRSIIPYVPPLYSLVLLPGFIVNSDPRVFYFTNIILSIISVALFYLILRKITKNKIILVFTTFLYITNYFIYWYPALVMAENLILPLFLFSAWLILERIKPPLIFFAGLVAIGFYITKYASLPLTFVFLFSYLLKILITNNSRVNKVKNILILSLGFGIPTVAFIFFEYSRGMNVLEPFNVFQTIFHTIFPPKIENLSPLVPVPVWFSINFIKVNLPHYLNAITGGVERFLWDQTPIIPKVVGIIGLIGLFWGLLSKKLRLLNFNLLIMNGFSILFISTFYAIDMRYIYPAIPTLLIGFAMFLTFILEKANTKRIKIIAYVLIIIGLSYYGLTNSLRLKNQIMLNLRHGETPWYYVSVLEMNRYFNTLDLSGKKPILISPMPPYLIDYFSNGNYNLLPLSLEQEFRKSMAIVWGSNDYSDLTKLYTSYLKKDYSVYVSRYGIGNEGYLNTEFNNLGKNFNMNRVQSGCYGQCDIYKLNLIKNP